MRFVDKPPSSENFKDIMKAYGDYVKVTADLENGWIVVGPKLHADGEKLLLEKGSGQDDIWGGGINLRDKIIDATAVLNIRPRLGNDSMEILDPDRRKKFVKIVKKYFAKLWMTK